MFQQSERESKNMNIDCLFCPDKLTGNRFAVSEHLYNEHSFTLGHPDNLVNVFYVFHTFLNIQINSYFPVWKSFPLSPFLSFLLT